MAVQGPLTWFDRALLKIGDGTLDLDTQAIKAVLLGSAQSISRTFTGSSGDARYADLTAELATANGYTAGGLALTSATLSRITVPKVSFSSNPISWTITGAGVTFKYMALYVDGATNKDLLMFCDMDVGGSTVTANAGFLIFTPDVTNGWGTWEQP